MNKTYSLRNSPSIVEEIDNFLQERWAEWRQAGSTSALCPAELRLVGIDSSDPRTRNLRATARQLRFNVFFNGELVENWVDEPPSSDAIARSASFPLVRHWNALLQQLPETPSGTVLKEIREMAGISRTDLAQCMGLANTSLISLYESGARPLGKRRQDFIECIQKLGRAPR